MSDEVCWYYDKEEGAHYGKDGDKVRVQTDERADSEERDCMRGLAPGEKALNTVLEDKNNSNPAQPSATFIEV